MNSDNGNGAAVKSLQGSTGVQNKDESKYENPVSRVFLPRWRLCPDRKSEPHFSVSSRSAFTLAGMGNGAS